MGFNLDKSTIDNIYYRRVILTTKHQQLVLMSISDYIEREVHPDNDQFIKVEKGSAKVIINDVDHYIVNEGDSITIPAGTYHEVIKIGPDPVKLYTIYSPPHHHPDTIQLYRPLND